MVPSGHPWPSWIVVSIGSAGVLTSAHATVYMLVMKRKIAGWRDCVAGLTSLDVSERRSKVGDATYTIKSTYTYERDGARYIGSRVGLLDSLPLYFGGYGRLEQVRLTTAFEAKRPISIRVDPQDPEQAVIFDIAISKFVAVALMVLALSLSCIALELLFERPSSAAVIVGLLLGSCGYFMWARMGLRVE